MGFNKRFLKKENIKYYFFNYFGLDHSIKNLKVFADKAIQYCFCLMEISRQNLITISAHANFHV